jgi:ATP-binding cassette subfamily B multidrug efflux pump
MSTPATKPAAPERPKFAPPPGARRPGGGGPFGGGMGMPVEKSLNFGPSARRLLRRMNPEKMGLIAVVFFGVVSVVFSVLGPKILGNATNIIFDGIISKQLPAGITQQQAVDGARASGNSTFANMLSAMTLTPGAGIDFTQLAMVLMWVLVLYVFASIFAYLQGYLLNGGRGQAEQTAAELPGQAPAR